MKLVCPGNSYPAPDSWNFTDGIVTGADREPGSVVYCSFAPFAVAKVKRTMIEFKLYI